MNGTRLACIGSGFMGEALVRGILAAHLFEPAEICVSDVVPERLANLAGLGVRATSSNAQAVAGAETILLAVKPQVIPEAAATVRPHLAPGALVISIAAGVSLAALERLFGTEIPVVRAMPNLLAAVGAAVTAIAAGNVATATHVERAEALFRAVGTTVRVEEKLMNIVTGVSGSGPAYLCLVIEALADAGVRGGLTRDTALHLAAQTVMGTGKLVLDKSLHPALLKDQVASPGGTTIAAIVALERAGLRAAVMEAVAAATARAAELERAAEK